jgi:hypothetical protein
MSGRVAFGFVFGIVVGCGFVAAGFTGLSVAGHDAGQDLVAFE